jgi:hypothetical protein
MNKYGSGSVFSEERRVRFCPGLFLFGAAVFLFAQSASRFTAILAETAVRAGIFFEDGLISHALV